MTNIFLLLVVIVAGPNSHVEVKKFYSHDACVVAAGYVNASFARYPATAASTATCIADTEPKDSHNNFWKNLTSEGNQ